MSIVTIRPAQFRHNSSLLSLPPYAHMITQNVIKDPHFSINLHTRLGNFNDLSEKNYTFAVKYQKRNLLLGILA